MKLVVLSEVETFINLSEKNPSYSLYSMLKYSNGK